MQKFMKKDKFFSHMQKLKLDQLVSKARGALSQGQDNGVILHQTKIVSIILFHNL